MGRMLEFRTDIARTFHAQCIRPSQIWSLLFIFNSKHNQILTCPGAKEARNDARSASLIIIIIIIIIIIFLLSLSLNK